VQDKKRLDNVNITTANSQEETKIAAAAAHVAPQL
jgi:hypothetical protein